MGGHAYVRVLQPSLSSGMLTVLVALASIFILLSPSLYKGSDFARYFDSINITDNSGYEKYQVVSETVNNSEFVADASVFAVWVVIGLFAYSIIASLMKLVGGFQRFITDIERFRTDRERILREALVHLLVRALAILALYALYSLFMGYGLAYLFLFAQAALAGSWLVGIWNVLLIALLVSFTIHFSVVLLRITLLRVRVFFDRYFVVEE
jgi:hypothetical protein